jgi:hypothetical protein
MVTNVSEVHTSSIFCPEDGGCRLIIIHHTALCYILKYYIVNQNVIRLYKIRRNGLKIMAYSGRNPIHDELFQNIAKSIFF